MKTLMAHLVGCVTRTGRVAMAETFLDQTDMVAPPSGRVADKWQLWVNNGSQ